jgi:AcrR family transcriptional regulator
MVDQTGKKLKRSWTHRTDNRERLIAAGYAILAEKGIEAATVKDIAERAEVSPGLFHYYFKSKDELLLAVLYEAGGRFKERAAEDLRGAFSSQGFPGAAMTKLQHASQNDPTWYRLRYELYALGMRNPDFLPEVGKFLAVARGEISKIVMEFTGVDEERATAAAAILLAISDGLALQQMAQPDLDLSGAYDLMKRVLGGDMPPES